MKNNRGSVWRRWDLHVHTASSEDYKYKAEDADELLVKAWKENNIEVVAITDHFTINAKRIENLRRLAPDMTIFPGVELRTDKGSTNIHVILIFSEEINLLELAQDFESIMLREKKQYKFEDIYWDYNNEIVKFAKQNNGIITIHAGNKSNGIDDKIDNSDLFRQAVKKEYAETVDIFEVSNINSLKGYKEHVLPKIGNKAVIICSDNHHPSDYKFNSELWIKADKTYKGLQQAIEHPEERIFVGKLPEKIVHEKRDTQYILDSIEVTKNAESINAYKWFDTKIKLNSSLVSIVGNKGTGKSAFSDILGLLGDSDNYTENYSSFLNKKRFNKSPEKYGRDYSAKIVWKDGHQKKVDNLYDIPGEESQTIQYLPQKYIEKVCTELGDNFQQEINKVLFSYLEEDDKLGASTFEGFIDQKTKKFEISIEDKVVQLKEINDKIIKLEEKLEKTYVEDLEKVKHEKTMELERETALKPKEIVRPEDFEQINNTEIEEVNKDLSEIEVKIKNKKMEIDKLKKKENEIDVFKTELELEIVKMKKLNIKIKDIFADYLKDYDLQLTLNTPLKNIKDILNQIKSNINKLDEELNNDTDGLIVRLKVLTKTKEKLTEESTKEIQEYYEYEKNIEVWKKKIYDIEENKAKEDSLASINQKLDYLNIHLNKDHAEALKTREKIVKEIFREKQNIIETYMTIYKPIDEALHEVLLTLDDSISFSANLSIDESILTNLLQIINKQYASMFYGTANANKQLNALIDEIDPNNIESLLRFTENFLEGCMTSGKQKTYDNLSKVIKDKNSLYLELFSLKFIKVDYSITLENKELTQLSPGERGLVLLIFYLVLSKDKRPIVIDQPEDNLDNQSIFSKLVPCIKEAKKNRQVILVTHNPNIAVACDSEQILIAEMDKINNEITYISGSIEDQYTNNKLVDILEGTQPAFDLRGRKYILTNN